jgi:bacteriorhodopsin
MVVTSLLASLTSCKKAAGGYYVMSCIAYLVVVYQLIYNCRNALKGKDSRTVKFFFAIATYTIIVWAIYLVYALPGHEAWPESSLLTFQNSIWGLAGGSRTINVNAEIVAYAILDILAKTVFGLWLLFTIDAVPST